MTHHQRILDYIERFGSITMLDAFRDLGITKCNSRISELRKQGYNIVGTWETSENRFGEPVRYIRYTMGDKS